MMVTKLSLGCRARLSAAPSHPNCPRGMWFCMLPGNLNLVFLLRGRNGACIQRGGGRPEAPLTWILALAGVELLKCGGASLLHRAGGCPPQRECWAWRRADRPQLAATRTCHFLFLATPWSHSWGPQASKSCHHVAGVLGYKSPMSPPKVYKESCMQELTHNLLLVWCPVGAG